MSAVLFSLCLPGYHPPPTSSPILPYVLSLWQGQPHNKMSRILLGYFWPRRWIAGFSRGTVNVGIHDEKGFYGRCGRYSGQEGGSACCWLSGASTACCWLSGGFIGISDCWDDYFLSSAYSILQQSPRPGRHRQKSKHPVSASRVFFSPPLSPKFLTLTVFSFVLSMSSMSRVLFLCLNKKLN